jgi:hypothetical protein
MVFITYVGAAVLGYCLATSVRLKEIKALREENSKLKNQDD